jgi:hypothetical protein
VEFFQFSSYAPALDDAYAARHVEVDPGQYVLFAISDTGKGMDKATLGQALDPVFYDEAGR